MQQTKKAVLDRACCPEGNCLCSRKTLYDATDPEKPGFWYIGHSGLVIVARCQWSKAVARSDKYALHVLAEKQHAEGLLSAETIKQANALMCVNPGCPRHPAYDRKQQFCTVCQAHYCSRNCQKAHWPEHKLRCKAAAARTEQFLKKLQATHGPEGVVAAMELARKLMAGQHGNAGAREEVLKMLGIGGSAIGADT